MKTDKELRVEKKCNICRQIKELKAFNKNNISPDKHAYTCRLCLSEHKLKHKYGLTKEDNILLYKKQEGKCNICKIFFLRKDLVVDHNHKTGKTRGLLCNSCNRGIGLLKDDIEVLLSAAKYLIEHQIPDPEGN